MNKSVCVYGVGGKVWDMIRGYKWIERRGKRNFTIISSPKNESCPWK